MRNNDADSESNHHVNGVPEFNEVPNIIDLQPNILNALDDITPILNPLEDQNVQQLPDDRNMCMKCLVVSMTESTQQFIVLPCGHAWVCGNCVRQLEHNPVCPMCRARNITFQRLFFS